MNMTNLNARIRAALVSFIVASAGWGVPCCMAQTVNSTVGNVQTVTVKISAALLTQPKLFFPVRAATP